VVNRQNKDNMILLVWNVAVTTYELNIHRSARKLNLGNVGVRVLVRSLDIYIYIDILAATFCDLC